jgi:YesN/AraC family two-component response regulator
MNADKMPYSLLDEIKSHIDSHYHMDISRESVADAFNISPGYLSRLFSRESDMKFNEYLKLARISRSKTLLINTTMKINEVSEKCGFTDTNYFCKVFRDINDCTPLEYRRKNKGKLIMTRTAKDEVQPFSSDRNLHIVAVGLRNRRGAYLHGCRAT